MSRTKADKPLTVKQKLFVAAYDGNGKEAARAAGYGGANPKDQYLSKQADRLLNLPHVVKALRERETNPIKPIMQPEAGYKEQRLLGSEKAKLRRLVADRKGRQEFWTQVMDDPEESMINRLRASELLGKSEGDFLQRIGGPDGGPVEVKSTVVFVDAKDGKPV